MWGGCVPGAPPGHTMREFGGLDSVWTVKICFVVECGAGQELARRRANEGHRGPPIPHSAPRFPPLSPVLPPFWQMVFLWQRYYGPLCLRGRSGRGGGGGRVPCSMANALLCVLGGWGGGSVTCACLPSKCCLWGTKGGGCGAGGRNAVSPSPGMRWMGGGGGGG